MNTKHYNKKWLKDSLYLLESALDDVGIWSIYNDDESRGDIVTIDELIQKIKAWNKIKDEKK